VYGAVLSNIALFLLKERKQKKIITGALVVVVIWRGKEVGGVWYAAEEKNRKKNGLI